MKRKLEIGLLLLLLIWIVPLHAYHALITGTARGLDVRNIHLSSSAWIEDQISVLDGYNKFVFVVDNSIPAMYTLIYGSGTAALKTDLFIFEDIYISLDLVSEPSGDKILLNSEDRRSSAFKQARSFMDNQWMLKRTDNVEEIVPRITSIPNIKNDDITQVYARAEMVNYTYLMAKNYGKEFDKKPFEREEFMYLPKNEPYYMGFPAYREVMAAYNMDKFMTTLTNEGKDIRDFEVVIRNLEPFAQNLPEQTRFDMMVQVFHTFPYKDISNKQSSSYVARLMQLISEHPNNEESILLESQMLNIMNSLVNQPAPYFKLKDKTGKAVSLVDFTNSFVLIDVWGSWCRPCRVKNQALLTLYNTIQEYSMDVKLVSISNDTDEDMWKHAIAQDGLVWTQLLADMDFLAAYSIKEYPTMILIDREGNIRKISSDISLNDLIEIMY